MTTAAIHQAATTGSFARAFAIAGTIAARLSTAFQAYKARRAIQSLASLDDRMLSDIGLTRGDVRDAFAQPVWRDPSQVLVSRVRERRYARGHTSTSMLFAPPTVPALDTELRVWPHVNR